MKIIKVNNKENEFWWCNTHGREANHIHDNEGYISHKKRCCDPKLGRILMACQCINLFGIIEISSVKEESSDEKTEI